MNIGVILTVIWSLLFAGSSALILPRTGILSLFKENTGQAKLEEFWDEARRFGPKAGQVVLDEIVKVYGETKHIVNDLKGATNDIVKEAQNLRGELQIFIDHKNITIEHLSDVLSDELGKAYLELRDEIVDPLPENHSDRAKARAELMGRTLQKVNKAYVRAMVSLGVPSERAELQFERISPKINRVLLVTGNIIDDYPQLLELVIFSASMLLLPEIQILRPIMNIFGFGPLGPIRGSTAAWIQSKFWGGFVRSGSWFSFLQKVGMTLTGSWIQKVVASTGLAALWGSWWTD